MTTSSTQDEFTQLEKHLENHMKKNNTYHFRPIQVDGINVYLVLYGKPKILNVESIYISCKVKINGKIVPQKYSLYHFNYTTIREALERVRSIQSGYRIFDGELVTRSYYKVCQLEKAVIPYSEDECCTVCYENTSDMTECKHAICLGCREKCILQDNADCPVCRSNNALKTYTNRCGLVNNNEYEELKRVIDSEHVSDDDDDNDEDDDDDNDDNDDNDDDYEDYEIQIHPENEDDEENEIFNFLGNM